MSGTTISLTSVPPRFAGLGPVLASLVAQGADAVELWLPARYARFPDWDGSLPDLPPGVTLRRAPADLGPATKLLPALAAHPGGRVLIADDDAVYGPGWRAGFEAAAARGAAVAASAYPVRRLGLGGAGEGDLIVQGFAGVMLTAAMIGAGAIPGRDRFVDDIWISARLAATGTPVICPRGLRGRVQALDAPQPLQQASPDGLTRATANRRSARALAAELGIWGSPQDIGNPSAR